MGLSKRMEAVVNMVSPQSFAIADVGCDHAYVSIELIERGLTPKVIAMDVRKGPLEIAKKNIQLTGLHNSIELRLGDGLERLEPDEVDTIIIAGMGGLLITGILERGNHILCSQNIRPTLILQPQSELSVVRTFLLEHAYCIAEETMLLEDGKYYTVIKGIPGAACVKPESSLECQAYMEYGEMNLQNHSEVLLSYLKKEYSILSGIYKELSKKERLLQENGEQLPEKTKTRMEEVQIQLKRNLFAQKSYGEV